MAKQFFKNLPDTSTPITADRLNGLLDGEEAMGNLVVDSIRSKNMFNPANLRTGYYKVADGTYDSSISYKCTSYKIEVDNTKEYVLTTGSTQSATMYVMYYDANGTYLGYGSTPITQQLSLHTSQYWVNTKYVNFRFDVNNVENIQLETGDTATAYSPYQELVTEDTGWVDITLINGATARSGDQYKPQCRRIGSVVYLKGQIDIPAHGAGTIYLTLPDGFKPAYEVSMLGFYRDTWIDISGNMTVNNDTTARTNQKLYTVFLIN